MQRSVQVDTTFSTRKSLMEFQNDIRQAILDISTAQKAGQFTDIDFDFDVIIKQTPFYRYDILINEVFTEVTFKYSQKREV